MRFALLLALALLTAGSAFAADGLIVCTKLRPEWTDIADGKLGWSGFGPAVIINQNASRVTWIGTGGYIRLTGEQSARGVKIIRIDGRSGQERITSSRKTGRVLDLELEDSMGGTGMLRVTLDAQGEGRADWQHATDTASRENLAYCTTNVLN